MDQNLNMTVRQNTKGLYFVYADHSDHNVDMFLGQFIMFSGFSVKKAEIKQEKIKNTLSINN